MRVSFEKSVSPETKLPPDTTPINGGVGSNANRVSLVEPFVMFPCLSIILALIARESPVLRELTVSITA